MSVNKHKQHILDTNLSIKPETSIISWCKGVSTNSVSPPLPSLRYHFDSGDICVIMQNLATGGNTSHLNTSPFLSSAEHSYFMNICRFLHKISWFAKKIVHSVTKVPKSWLSLHISALDILKQMLNCIKEICINATAQNWSLLACILYGKCPLRYRPLRYFSW